MFQQTIGIPVGTNCAPLHADSILHTYEANFLQGFLKNKYWKLAQTLNSIFFLYRCCFVTEQFLIRCLSALHLSKWASSQGYYWHWKVCFLPWHSHWNRQPGKIKKKNDKHDDFIFPIVNFSFISSNIPASPAYGVYISQLVRYSRACAQYSDFIDRVQLLTQKLLKQGYIAHKLKSSLQTSTVINTKYSYLKLHWIFYLLRRFCLSSIIVKIFNELTVFRVV